VCAVQAIRVQRLLVSALWLAGCSALVALLLFLVGGPEIAVIELSVGAGLVTVLFVFAINIAGEEPLTLKALIPKPLSIGLIVLSVALLGWMVLPAWLGYTGGEAELGFAATLWQDRSLDLMLQVLLIFAGVLGVVGLLADPQPHQSEEE
jgi:uncharacterized MnhB-related membrane protein